MTKNNSAKESIASLDLRKDGQPVHFIYKTMEEIAEEAASTSISHTPHRHNYYSVIWVREGRGRHFIDFRNYEVLPGTIFFISPEQVHDLRMEPGHSGDVMLFTTDFIEQNGVPVYWLRESGFFFRCDDVAPLVIPQDWDTSALKGIMGQIAKEYRDQQKFYYEAIASLMKLFLLECKRIRAITGQVTEERLHSKAQIIKQFKDLLDSNFQEWHKVSDYAAELHITANYLNEVLSNETGMSAKDFIINRIMLEAKRFATYSQTSAKEVAYQLGFDDPAHFSKLFRQHEGTSFTSFRENLQKSMEDQAGGK
jgi:AraC family transcriptional activator of pobA